MNRNLSQVSLGSSLVLIICIGLNAWLFRLGVLWGIVGLNVTKHVLIAILCNRLGIDRRRDENSPAQVQRPDRAVPSIN